MEFTKIFNIELKKNKNYLKLICFYLKLYSIFFRKQKTWFLSQNTFFFLDSRGGGMANWISKKWLIGSKTSYHQGYLIDNTERLLIYYLQYTDKFKRLTLEHCYFKNIFNRTKYLLSFFTAVKKIKDGKITNPNSNECWFQLRQRITISVFTYIPWTSLKMLLGPKVKPDQSENQWGA